MKNQAVLAIDAGGTFFKSALIKNNCAVAELSEKEYAINSASDREFLLAVYYRIFSDYQIEAGLRNLEISGMAISTPGPFDYSSGTYRMQHKFASLFGTSLPEKIKEHFSPGRDFRFYFMHDVHAFLCGELFAGAARGEDSVMAITIGTGLGFGYFKEGRIVDNSTGGPCYCLFRQKHENGILEDIISRRGLISAYKRFSGRLDSIDVKAIADLARAGNVPAQQAFQQAGQVLSEHLRILVSAYSCSCIVFGGQISKSLDLFNIKQPAPGIKITVQQNPHSPLIGAALPLFQGSGNYNAEKKI